MMGYHPSYRYSEVKSMAMNDSQNKKQQVLIIGGGIGGLCAALSLAELNIPVLLVEKSSAVGGILNQLDQQFPNDHCGICRMLPMVNREDGFQFCARRGIFQEKITVMTRTIVTSVSGTPGRFSASLEETFAGIDAEKCTLCGACMECCPVEVPDDFNAGLSCRKAAYQPVPFGINPSPVIDWDHCTQCGACVEACAEGAIFLEDKTRNFQVEGIAGMIYAGGVELTDPRDFDVYGFGVLPNVVTATAFERILSSSGPFSGKPVRPSDGKPIGKIAWIQCVGSRNIMIGADFCSSACCMFALKEARLAKAKLGEETDTALFYMDMRTFGRDFQRYRDETEKKHGVRLVRCRVHSIEPGENSGDLKLAFMDHSGVQKEESFDLVVLSTGQKKSGNNLAETLGMASSEGLEILDSAMGLKDIAATVISASKTASRMAALVSGATDKASSEIKAGTEMEETGYTERPRIGVAVCLPDSDKDGMLDQEGFVASLGSLPEPVAVRFFKGSRAQEEWGLVGDFVRENKLNRLVVVSPRPDRLSPTTLALYRQSGLTTPRVEFVDLHLVTGHKQEVSEKTRIALGVVEMAINRLRSRKARTGMSVDVAKQALIIGSGPAGLSAAIALAAFNLPVTLIEKADSLGGNAANIVDPETRKRVDDLIQKVETLDGIRILKNCQWKETEGFAGKFSTTVTLDTGENQKINHGAMIFATGGGKAEFTEYTCGGHEKILTQFDLEHRLSDSQTSLTDVKSVVMIQCAGSREEPRNYCSRICCVKALKNAIRIKEASPETTVYVLYRDIMTYGEQEQIYTQARRLGVLFVPFDLPERPGVSLDENGPTVEIVDPILNEALCLKPDLLVLSSGVVPGSSTGFAEAGLCQITEDGFIQEADSKWRPMDTGREGVFVCGLARNPVNAKEAMDEGEAAALRALRVLSRDRLHPQRLAARVRHALCSRCGLCISACMYGARYFDPQTRQVMVDPASCQGCGTCAAVCPNSATVMGDFEDNGVMDALEAALD